jgi:hypothetical protein
VYALSGAAGSGTPESYSEGERTSAGRIEELVATPWLEDLSHVVMCVAMGFLLILML